MNAQRNCEVRSADVPLGLLRAGERTSPFFCGITLVPIPARGVIAAALDRTNDGAACRAWQEWVARTTLGRMSDQQIEPVRRPFAATLTPPGSKSLTNRALVLAALAEGP